ncbi:MAG: hypothetical protein AAGJ37_08420, partial [Pseudomonadota bacterium]
DSKKDESVEAYFRALERYKALSNESGQLTGKADDESTNAGSQDITAIDSDLNITYSSIVQTAMDPLSSANAGTLKKINASLIYRRQYQRVIKMLSFSYSPRLVAASTEELITQRSGEGFTLAVGSPERHLGDQIKVSLSLSDASITDSESMHLHCFFDDKVLPLKLRKTFEVNYEATISKDNILTIALCNVDCEIYIQGGIS